MHALKGMSARAAREMEMLRSQQLLMQWAGLSMRAMRSLPKVVVPIKEEETIQWPRKVFSGIQPTGGLHLGNYLGAVQKWTHLQNNRDDVTYCIVDMHSITMPQDAFTLRQNIFQMAATVLACGIDPDRATIFVQSAVKEHAELCWILSCLSTMARLGHLPQYKEKTRNVKDIPLGLFVYPVLQAADIMAYKTTHVPVGEDQVQHIQLAQHLAKVFNTKYGPTFPICHAIIDNNDAKRIRSLREPSKKMSKSDPDTRATINILDEPDVITEKIKKAVTDFTSDVTYDPSNRLGVSNLVAIHSLVTDKPVLKIVEEAKSIDTAHYKLRVAEAVVEHLKPIREKVNLHLSRQTELIYLLDAGAEKARRVAQQTLEEVRQKVGLGATHLPVLSLIEEAPKEAAAETPKTPQKKQSNKFEKPVVPRQELRVEKKMEIKVEIKKDHGKTESLPIALEPKLPAVVNYKQEVKSAVITPKAEAETDSEKQPKEIKL